MLSGTILFAGGGSGGHLYPGVAVAESLVRIAPGIKPLFLCTQREIDSTILKSTPFEFLTQPIVPPRKSVGGLIRFFRAWTATQDVIRQTLRDVKPIGVLGLGGYAAGVAVKACAKAKIPAALLNPDVVPGRANQYLFPFVSRIYGQFEATREQLPTAHRHKFVLSGCPIRQDLVNLPPRDEARRRLALDPSLHTLLVTGASQGAVSVNDAVLEVLSRMKKADRELQGWQILHLAGRDNADAVRSAYRELELPGRVVDFTPAMADVWASSDLAVSRSGASSCAELTACGVPSILMPYPMHRDQHQRINAEQLVLAHAALVIQDKKDRAANADQLLPIIDSLLYDVPRRRAMADAARSIARPNAADIVAQSLLDLIRA